MLLAMSQKDCPISWLFWSQNDCLVCAWQKFEAHSQIFSCQILYIKKSFDTATSGVVAISYLRSYTYDYLVNGH